MLKAQKIGITLIILSVLIFLIYITYFGKVDWNVKLIASAIFSFGVAMTVTFSKFPLNLNEAHKTMLRVIAFITILLAVFAGLIGL